MKPEPAHAPLNILLVDDDQILRESLKELLADSGYNVADVGTGKEALAWLHKKCPDILITDMKMPDMDGLKLLRESKKVCANIPVILITGHGSIEHAVTAMKEGAYHYITKPFSDAELKIVLERLRQQRSMERENLDLKKQLSVSRRERFHNIVGKCPRMQKIYTLIEAISNTRSTVLINGESGTGKRVIAHAIHKFNEHERGKPFIEVSCGALTETLLESELFGHVKGAFTGAIRDRAGRFELSHGGTIFLDEIDAFSPALQVKLLRVLQEGEFERVGDTNTVKIDVRVIAATNQNLQELITHGKFRKDLYYRLNIINIELPPLRERTEDIPLLVEDFLHRHTTHNTRKVTGMTPEALEVLMHYHWPGNIRELENVIERAVILSKGTVLTPEDFPEPIAHAAKQAQTGPVTAQAGGHQSNLKLKDALLSPEKDLIVKALNASDWNRNEAAKILGINRTTLYKKMHRFNLLKKKQSQ